MASITEDMIAEAFARIEMALLRSMIRNFEKHRVDQIKEGREWERWQSVQLAELNRYVRRNLRKGGGAFDKVNKMVDQLLSEAYESGLSAFERLKLRAMRSGLGAVTKARSLLGIPTERLDVLVEATHSDLMRAEYATLRKAEDDFRSIVFNAQVYATSGAGTYSQAIDMATKDLLAKGLKGITYSNGSRHSIEEYATMAVRTAAKRAALVAEGRQRQEWGVHTIFINRRPDACPVCMRWVGQVLVDDVYSGGTKEEAEAGGYALLSDAMEQGLFHPNCRDTAATYYPGITQLPDPPTEEEMAAAIEREKQENRLSDAKSRKRAAERKAELSLEKGNREEGRERAEQLDDEIGLMEVAIEDMDREAADALEGPDEAV
ncbi:MAG: hypothetical protein IKG69_08550 [Atopobiaceae bacterium]|nr:hypothetical protein [Atopobiaceae bacterium]